jgi:hypothetical protein
MNKTDSNAFRQGLPLSGLIPVKDLLTILPQLLREGAPVEDKLICGAPTGGSWCDYHLGIVFDPKARKR